MKLFMKRNRRVLVFGMVVMLFLIGVGVIQLVLNQYQPFKDTAVVKVEDNKEDKIKEEKPTVTTEKLLKPVSDDVKIVKKFYDASLSDAELEKALVYFEGILTHSNTMTTTFGCKYILITYIFNSKTTRR